MSDTPANTIQHRLQQGVVQVKFIKADGSERTMLATTRAELIAQHTVPDPDKPRRAATPGVIRVCDTEKSAWRSIVESRILDWKPVG